MAWITRLNKTLQGEPEETLTVILLGLAALLVLIALCAPPLVKAGAVAWVLLP